ncbi:hypothetical protein [Streptomyces sp. NPDC021020]|uniref:hypothetical protein n=1 Tax=Streptomyces sp. NPDC021020 TaxID=3365109 RepID=UPI0037B52311
MTAGHGRGHGRGRGSVRWAACCLLLAVAACGSHSGPPSPPKAGQAAAFGDFTGGAPAQRALREGVGGPAGFATGPDGSGYLLEHPTLARLTPAGKVSEIASAATDFGGAEPTGLTVGPDGSVYWGHDGEIKRYDDRRGTVVVAGRSSTERADDAAADAVETAATARLTQEAGPVGVTRSGAVVIADGRALWSLSSGRLTRLFQRPAGAHGGRAAISAEGAAVAPDGSAYLLPARGDKAFDLAHVEVVSPSGKASALGLPPTLPGVDGPLATLAPSWMASDGAGGVYVHALRVDPGSPVGDYVLHLSGGKAELVASGTTEEDSSTTGCKATDPVDATRFPCPLPAAIGYRNGTLTLAGEREYAVKIAVGGS